MLKRKMEMYRVPLQQLKLNYSVSTTNKKVYTEDEDRFLLVMLDKYGFDGEGIYEHSKRKSKAFTTLDAKPGQYYIARMKAYTVTMQTSCSSSPISPRYDTGGVLVVGSRRATGAGRISHRKKRAICTVTHVYIYIVEDENALEVLLFSSINQDTGEESIAAQVAQ